MTRLPYPNMEDLDPRVRGFVEGGVQLNLIKLMAHAQGSVESVLRLSDAVLNRGKLDPIVRQVALIRLCVVIGSDYERLLLESVSRGEGLSEPLIEAARDGSTSPHLNETERMAAKLAEELAVNVKPSPETYVYFADRLPPREFIELVQSIGFYLMQARLIETFSVTPEDPPIDLSKRFDSMNNDALEAWRQGQL